MKAFRATLMTSLLAVVAISLAAGAELWSSRGRSRPAGSAVARHNHSFTFCSQGAAAFAVLALTALLSACTSNPGATFAKSGSSILDYRTVAQVEAAVEAAQSLQSPPKNVLPPISKLAAGQEFGDTLQLIQRCPPLGVNGSSQSLSNCTFGDITAKRVVALVGDSRAQMWLDTLAHLGSIEHFKLVLIAKSGCPVPLGTYQTNNDGAVTATSWQACSAFQSFIVKSVRALHPQVILISSNTALDLADPPHVAAPPEIESDMVRFLRLLPTSSRRVVLGGFPQPASDSNPTLCLSKTPSSISSCNFVPSPTVVADNQAFQSAAAMTGTAFINQTPWFCAAECPSIVAGIIPYTIDGYHADKPYLNYLTRALWTSLKPFVGEV